MLKAHWVHLFSLQWIIASRNGKIVLWVKCLLCKKEDLSSVLQHPHKSQAWWPIPAPALGEGRDGRLKGLLVGQSSQNGKLCWVRDTVSKIEKEAWVHLYTHRYPRAPYKQAYCHIVAISPWGNIHSDILGGTVHWNQLKRGGWEVRWMPKSQIT